MIKMYYTGDFDPATFGIWVVPNTEYEVIDIDE